VFADYTGADRGTHRRPVLRRRSVGAHALAGELPGRPRDERSARRRVGL